MFVRKDNLNTYMDFGHVIYVTETGEVLEDPNVSANPPEFLDINEIDEDAPHSWEPWQLLTGWTGQYGYNGGCFHPSEFIGGALAEHILSTPGNWVAVTVEDPETPDLDIGWALLHLPKE